MGPSPVTQDTNLHRLTESGEGQVNWDWTRTRIASINRTEPRRVPREWLLTPHFQLWFPPETAGGIVDLGERGVPPGAETQNIATTGLYRLHA